MNRVMVSLVVLSLTALAACNKKQSEPATAAPALDTSKAVAKVGDDTLVTVDEMELRIKSQPAAIRPIYANVEKKKELLDNVLRFELMAKEAIARGFDKDPEVQRIVKEQAISKFLKHDYDNTGKPTDVSDAAVEKYYKDHPAEFHKADLIQTAEVVVPTEAKAREVVRAAKAAKSDPAGFAAVVNKYSDDALAKARAGDMAFFDRNTTAYEKPVVEAAFALKEVGDVSPPVKTAKGFHVIRLSQKMPGFDKSLADAKKQIQERIFYEGRAKAMDDLVANLRNKFKVEIYEANLQKVSVASEAPAHPTTAKAE